MAFDLYSFSQLIAVMWGVSVFALLPLVCSLADYFVEKRIGLWERRTGKKFVPWLDRLISRFKKK